MIEEVNTSTFYRENGYFIHPRPVLPEDLVRAASAGMDEIREGRYDTGRPPCDSPWRPGDDPNILCKIENPQFANRAIREAISHPELGKAAAEASGAAWIQVWWVQLLYKPPATSASRPAVGWHRDRTYWGSWTADSELFTIWLAMSEVDEESGPMMFVPGSHVWQTDAGGDFFNADPESQKASIPIPPGKEWREVPALMDAGGFSIHHCGIYHGSGPNVGPRPRRSFAIHVRTGRSRPIGDQRFLLTEFIDDFDVCPVIYGG